MPDLAETLSDITARMLAEPERGHVADYIPELAKVSPQHFGITVITADGQEQSAGDAHVPFSIQSVSKVFALVEALQSHGEAVWARVGREPSGSAFNSIVQLEAEGGRPRNPFINAGAIAVTDLIAAGHEPREGIGAILRLVRRLTGDPSITVDGAVAYSEAATGFRNAGLANFMKSFGIIAGPVGNALDVYFHQCAIAMTTRQLARAGRFLMNAGVCPDSGNAIVTPERSRRIAALMLTCGHYDASGDFAFKVGLPAKSGVGGGILAIAPGQASIAVWSPGLSPQGNSLLGTQALEDLSRAMGWNVFQP
ncbi:glutaminase [Polymorphobacter multimanifer]|uniref:glutaminase n=1 Tax=Polymorphobacter multimanifer TaxID=1070431 RepID=UPI001667A701|nr:glutaminase [Polymorphobacter multimanifer]GGI74466.1 glutaminase [Polymorphobacter multimanifer]